MATDNVTVSYVDSSRSWPAAAAERGEPTPESSSQESPPSLAVRPVALADLPALIRFPGTMRLDVPDSLVVPQSTFLGLPASLPILRRDRPVFVATADGQQVGFVRISPRRPDGRWIISAIGASTGVYPPEPVWEALLSHGVRAGGLRGVRRVFARVPSGHPLVSVMRQSGWVAYSSETVFRAKTLTRLGDDKARIRRQEPPDTWAIHQLYAATVPRHVQEIEAITSHVWHMDNRQRPRRSPRQTGWLLTEGDQLAGYARYASGSQTAMIDVVVAPGMRNHLGALLDAIIGAHGRSAKHAVYFALRGYLMDLKDELTARGFVEIGDQELLIRYTTATARAPAVDPIHFPVELRPTVPRRVPTFLEGQPTDGAL